jgi:nucleoid-associated protein YgaU
MYINNPVRRALAAAVLATSAAIAVGAVGAARADSSVKPDTGSIVVAPASAAESPPGVDGGGEAPHAGKNVTVLDQYEVADGDSFWAIAERQLPDGATKGDVLTLTNALMAHNGPRLGHGDPAMLKPGDIVDIVAAPSQPVPAALALRAPAAATVAPTAHEVVAGDSYWAIAESILGDEATPADVLEKTEDLIEVNGRRLGYEDPQMLHPGDVVYLDEAASTTGVPADERADAESSVTKDSKPSMIDTSTVSPEPAATASWTTWTTPWLTSRGAAYRQTPTSPPLSEMALITLETTSPLKPATSGGNPVDKPTRKERDDLHRGGELPSTPRSRSTPVYASAS